MGLDTSHDCWHGPYSAFHRWRMKIARLAGIPLPFMEGFFRIDEYYCRSINDIPEHIKRFAPFVPIKWESLRYDPLHFLLNHSDCGGHITWKRAKKIAERLEEILSQMDPKDDEDEWLYSKTKQFIKGAYEAYNAKENIEFH